MATTSYFHGTRVFKKDEQARPIAVDDYSVIGAIVVAPAADSTEWPLNEPKVLFSTETEKITKLGAGGNVAAVFDAINDQANEYFTAAEIVAVRVAEGTGATDAEKLEATMANIVGTFAAKTGVHALLNAPSRPRILIAPGYTHQRISTAKNPVAAELDSIAARLRAIKILDAPANTKEAALEYREDFADDKRAYLISPAGLVTGPGGTPIVQPLSGRAAGLFVRRDKTVGGPHESPSNQAIGGLVGVSRPISYYDGEPDSEANWLNENRIATVIEGGILWGNETCAADPLERFVNVVRVEDMIDGAVVKSFRWAIAKNLNVPVASAIVQSLDDFLGEASVKGQIINGRVWFEPAINTNANMASGILRLEYDREPYAPLQDLQFAASRNVGYYEQVAEGIQRAVEQITASRRRLTYGINVDLNGG